MYHLTPPPPKKKNNNDAELHTIDTTPLFPILPPYAILSLPTSPYPMFYSLSFLLGSGVRITSCTEHL